MAPVAPLIAVQLAPIASQRSHCREPMPSRLTHEPSAAAYADRVLFLADGRIVDQMDGPTEASVLDKLKSLGG